METKEKSPFAVRKNEIKVFDGKDGYISVNQIEGRLKTNGINKYHIEILKIINEFEFITSKQIFEILQIRKIDIPKMQNLKTRLESMLKMKMITRYYFKTENSSSDFRVYAIEKLGKYLLDKYEIETTWKQIDLAKNADKVKRKLATNQFIISYISNLKNLESVSLGKVINTKTQTQRVKVAAAVKIKYKDQSINFLIETVRRGKEWKKHLLRKLKFIENFYYNYNCNEDGFETVPQIIFLCEDGRHTAEVFREIIINNINLEDVSVYYTYDILSKEKELDRSLLCFRLKDGKYQKIMLKAKLFEINE